MEFKNRIKELREEKGLSQQAVADSIYVSRSAIAKWENGLGLPSKESLRLLSEFYNIEEQDLLKEQNYEKELVSKNIKISRMQLWIGLSYGVVVIMILSMVILGYFKKAQENNHLIYSNIPVITINNEEITFYQVGSEYKIASNGELKKYDYALVFPGTATYESLNLIGVNNLYQINVSNTTINIFGNYYYLNEDFIRAEEPTGWDLYKLYRLNIENDGTFQFEESDYHFIVIELNVEFPDLCVNYYFVIDLR